MSEIVTLERAGELLGPTGKPRSRRTVYQYARRGVKVNGRVVKLRTVRLPHGMAVRVSDIRAFIAELNAGHLSEIGDSASELTLDDLEASAAGVVKRCADTDVGSYPAGMRSRSCASAGTREAGIGRGPVPASS